MLDSLKRRPGSLRWPPRQRFQVSDAGRQAVADWNDRIERYQAGEGRSREDLERARLDWAGQFKVEANDASLLAEFAVKERQPRDVQSALQDCGVTLQDVQAAVDRLYTAGLLAPVGGGGPLPPSQPRDPEV
jgi:hypothetical protein